MEIFASLAGTAAVGAGVIGGLYIALTTLRSSNPGRQAPDRQLAAMIATSLAGNIPLTNDLDEAGPALAEAGRLR